MQNITKTECSFGLILSLSAVITFCKKCKKVLFIYFSQNLKNSILGPFHPKIWKQGKKIFPKKSYKSILSLNATVLRAKKGKFYARIFYNTWKTSFSAHWTKKCYCNFMQKKENFQALKTVLGIFWAAFDPKISKHSLDLYKKS